MVIIMNKTFELFNFTDIFDFNRGTRFTKNEQVPGEIPYISSTKKNNGIDNYVNPPLYSKKGSKITIYNNCMTLSNSGSVGYLYYHNYNFVASDHVTVIWLKDSNKQLTRNIALYLKPIFESMKYKYNFGREISNDRLKKEKILLPIISSGIPDWDYMESFITQRENGICFNNINKKNEINFSKGLIDTSNWKFFNLVNIWDTVKRGERQKSEDRIPGDMPYYSASVDNNGRTDAISNPTFTTNDALIYTTFGDCFYVEGVFTASDEISIFKHSKLNKYNALFIATVLNQSKYKYQFGRKAFYNKIENEKIKLPAVQNQSGEIEPDWQYMEEYIKSLPYSSNI